MPYWTIPDDAYDDPEQMACWVRLAYEAASAPDTEGRRWAELSLTTWPGGENQVLARGHPHGFALEWFGPGS